MKHVIKKSIARVLSMLLSAVLLASAFGDRADIAEAAELYSLTEQKYQGEYGVDKGYVYTPTNVKGTLPAVIFIHGMGGLKKDTYKRQVEKFINSGYISPFVLIMPDLYGVGHDAYVCKDKDSREWLNKVITRMDNGKFDTDTVKIDKTSGYSIAGYSMGGSAAILAGIAYSGKFINVGGFSPSIQLHDPANGVSWITSSSETKSCEFTSDSNRHLLISSGSSPSENTNKDEDGHLACSNRCLKLFGENNGFAQIVYDYPTHDDYLFAQEFFNFLYYIQHDEMPSAEIINEVFAEDTNYSSKGNEFPGPLARKRMIMPDGKVLSDIESQPAAKPIINSITTTAENGYIKMGEPYSITVDATGTDLKYQWEWRTDEQPWAVSTVDGNTTSTIYPKGKRDVVYYRCKVTSGTESVTSDVITILLDKSSNEVSTKPVINSITTTAENGYIKMGEPYSITVDATGTDLKYQWEWSTDEQPWAASTVDGNTTSTIYPKGKRDVVYYRCKVTSGTESVTSDVITIKLEK